MNKEFKTHPSYGQITLTKPVSGRGVNLFGSKVRHPSFVSMRISTAKISEDGFSEFIFGERAFVEIHMSEAQWAHMVSSFGDGSGTPVTISYREGHGNIEAPPDAVPVIDLAKKSADETKQALVKRLKDLEADVKNLSEKEGTVKKKDLTRLALDFNILASWLSGNFDFLENQVKERMEKEVAKAHIEIDALVSNAITRLGERALGQQLASGDITDVSKLIGGQ